PEKVDMCISNVFGAIGSSEGAIHILNNARRFLTADGVFIPQRCITKIAAVCLPDALRENPGFSEVPEYYATKIFEKIGYEFDVRLCVKNFPKSHIISNIETFEDLDFRNGNKIEQNYEHEIDFVVNKNAKLSGFLLWINIHTIENEVIDVLEHEHSWLPV